MNISIPIHLRYHKAAKKEKFVPVSLSPPTILGKYNHGKCIIIIKKVAFYCFLCSEESMTVQCVPEECISENSLENFYILDIGLKG